MEQRRLRLGDILDDYCPRERRVTNHAIVAMIEEDIKQTRCTTCDAEHAYKGARVPKRRKKDSALAAVLAGAPAPETAPAPAIAAPVAEASPETSSAAAPEPRDAREPEPPVEGQSPQFESVVDAPRDEPEAEPNPAAVDCPVHRPLIRATLPRPEGQKDTRPVPDFTIRHAPNRGGGQNFRDRMRMRGNGNGNGNWAHGSGRFHGGGGNRHPGGRQSTGRGGGSSGFRGGNSGPNGRRGRGSR